MYTMYVEFPFDTINGTWLPSIMPTRLNLLTIDSTVIIKRCISRSIAVGCSG